MSLEVASICLDASLEMLQPLYYRHTLLQGDLPLPS